MSDVDCSCICHYCRDSLNHTNDDTCYDSRMAYSDLAYCDCDGCRNGAAELNTCVDCRHNNDDDE